MCNFLIKTSLRGSPLLSLSLFLSFLLFILEITVIIPSISIFPLPSPIFCFPSPSTLSHACHCVTRLARPSSSLVPRGSMIRFYDGNGEIDDRVSIEQREREGGKGKGEEGDDGGYVGRSPDVPSEREWDNILRDAQLTSDDCARWRKQYVSRYDLRSITRSALHSLFGEFHSNFRFGEQRSISAYPTYDFNTLFDVSSNILSKMRNVAFSRRKILEKKKSCDFLIFWRRSEM